MKILALDLATHTGWAHNIEGVQVGTWTLATAKEVTAWGKLRLTRRQDPRVLRLATQVGLFCREVDCIIFEDVEFGSSRMQTQLWSSLRAAVWLACKACHCDIHFDCVNVKTLKKFATGNGNADKAMMVAAAQRQRPNLIFDEDSADAYHVLQWGINHIRL